MTTPASPAQAQQAPPSGLGNPALAAAVAGALVTAVSAAAAVVVLQAQFTLAAATWRALSAALGVVMAHPPGRTGVAGPASAATSSMNHARRAQFVLAAARRILTAERDASARGQDRAGALARALAAERRYYGQHTGAMWNRAVAAGKTDMAALEHGPVLGWNTVRDTRTSPECRAADGWNYRADQMPSIGYPGGVHPHCRCFPGPPYPGAPLIPSRHVTYARAA